ncbi:MAG: hypothetical protein RLZZ224_1264 [Verrucomicrobiota bacterium]|jgi:hypothetical protein
MDAKLQDPKIQALIARNQQARRALGTHLIRLQRAIDLPLRVSDSLRTHRSWWIAGSAAVGVMASSLFRRSPAKTHTSSMTPTKKQGIFALALTTAFSLAKPAIKSWLIHELQKRFLPTQPDHKKTFWRR